MNDASGRTFVIRILNDPRFKAFEESCAKDPDRLPSIEIGSLPIHRRMEDAFTKIGAQPKDFVHTPDYIDMRWVCPKPIDLHTLEILREAFPTAEYHPGSVGRVIEETRLKWCETLVALTAPANRLEEALGDYDNDLAELLKRFRRRRAIWIMRYRVTVATFHRLPAIALRTFRLWYFVG
jgi:hypothetical protein